jgi:hypothetical protein
LLTFLDDDKQQKKIGFFNSMRSRHVAITHDTWLRANGKAPENYTVAELAEVGVECVAGDCC